MENYGKQKCHEQLARDSNKVSNKFSILKTKGTSFCRKDITVEADLPTLPVFSGVSKFVIKSLGVLVRAPNLPRTTYCGSFSFFFINFVICETSKRKIKQEGNLLLLFELLSTGKRKTEQFDIYLTSILIGQKSTNQIVQYMVQNWRGFRMLFTSVEAKMASMDFGSPPGFCSLGVQVWLRCFNNYVL